MRRFFLLFIPLVLLPVLLLVNGCTLALFSEKEEINRMIDVEDGVVLEVYNRNGSVKISSWDENRIELHAVKRGTLGSKLDEVQVEVNTVESGLVIETVYLNDRINISVSYELKVPAGVIVEMVESSNGSITVTGTTGDLVARTSNGSVNLADINGEIRARSSNGSINISGVTAVLQAETSNGKVEVELPEINEDVSISSSNGTITVYISTHLDARLRMNTSNGKINLHDITMNISSKTDNSFEGTIGEGGYTVTVKTSNGSINLYPLD